MEMSCRSGATRGCDPLQPLRATVPFQLHNETQRCRFDKTVDRIKCRPPKPTIRRTLSLDAIIGPYLQGQWPKELENPSVSCVNDKTTQVSARMSHHTPTSSEPSAVLTPGPVGRGTAAGIKKLTPNSWAEESRGRRSIGGHKRSASWSSTEHLREVAKLRHQLQKRSRHAAPSGGYDRPHHPLPGGHAAGTTQTILLTPLSRLAPRLRRSVEGLNLELEGVFVTERPEEQHKILDVPDGHRAPVPAPRCSSGSQRDPSPAHLDLAFPSPSQSPGILEPSPLSLSRSPCCLNPALLSPSHSPCPMVESDPVECEAQCPPSTPPSPVALDTSLSKPYSWPRPNKTYTFQREPPEGCERVRVCEETSPSQGGPFLQPSCPDPNKVNFTPHGGSAFCPVSLLKPLLPSMDILFRGLSVSPVTGCSGQSSVPYQATGHAVGGYLSGSFQE